jgi:hypothetical protein
MAASCPDPENDAGPPSVRMATAIAIKRGLMASSKSAAAVTSKAVLKTLESDRTGPSRCDSSIASCPKNGVALQAKPGNPTAAKGTRSRNAFSIASLHYSGVIANDHFMRYAKPGGVRGIADKSARHWRQPG